MPKNNDWEIIDADGTIHSGTKDEMELAFDVMKSTTQELVELYRWNTKTAEEMRRKYGCSWNGDLKLIEIHSTYR